MQGGNPFGAQGFGGPGGMGFEQDDSFIIGGNRHKAKKVDPNSPTVNREGGVFHEKLGSIIGPAYIGGKYTNGQWSRLD